MRAPGRKRRGGCGEGGKGEGEEVERRASSDGIPSIPLFNEHSLDEQS